MAKSRMKDQYANKAYGSVTESAANTLTFSEITTNVNIFDKVAWVLTRIEWYLNQATLGLILDSADHLEIGLTASNGITSLSLSEAAVIDVLDYQRLQATSVGFSYFDMPLVRDFGTMPGGGLIIAPRPLYVAAKGTSLASAASAECRFYFQQFEMAADEYLELIDFYRIVS